MTETEIESNLDAKNSSNIITKKPIPRGKFKSGRFWKDEKQRFKSIIQVKPLKKTLNKRTRERREREEILSLTRSIKEEKLRKKEAARERRLLNEQRRKENERKSEVVQVITDTRKIKRMKRKQLKYIEMRDTSEISKTKSYV